MVFFILKEFVFQSSFMYKVQLLPFVAKNETMHLAVHVLDYYLE